MQWRTPGGQLRKASDGSEDTLSLNNAGVGDNSAGSEQRNASGGVLAILIPARNAVHLVYLP